MRYTLDDGEERQREAPDTFWMPRREDRCSLQPGQVVKLIFRIELDDEVHVERMWVIVSRIEGNGYVGELNNQPYCTNELRPGDIVRFEPRHVIDIEESGAH